MNAYQLAQEYDNLRWGTGMPVALMIGSEMVQVRARGTYALKVTDPQRLTEQVPDPDDLMAAMRPLFANAIRDVIGERSLEVANVAQLTTVTEQTTQAFQAKLDPQLTALGLQLKSVYIEAIEKL